jgi:hypothetical protein
MMQLWWNGVGRSLPGLYARSLATSSSTGKKLSVLELFKSFSKKTAPFQDPLTKKLLAGETEEYHGHSHGDHARALEEDLKRQQALSASKEVDHGQDHGHSHGDHGHSHGDHGHSHDDHGHSHSVSEAPKAKAKQQNLLEETEDDFVEMWNSKAPYGPEHGGPRGLEPTRYGKEWESKGRVRDFT